MFIVAEERCEECGRIFDLLDPVDSTDWSYGHDCEGEDGA